MAAALTDTTLMVVVAGYAFDRRRRRHRDMCHGKFGCPFGCGPLNSEGWPVGG